MPDAQSPTIAVVGAAGFVGRELLRQFERAGTPVTALVRGFPELAVEGTFHRAVPAEQLQGQRFDIVINLAYPTSGALFEQAEYNRAIIDLVNGLVRDGGRLIQVSTIAVFGMTLNRPIKVGPVEPFRDMAYVEEKISAELAFAEEQRTRGLSLDVVRLGNVWGAGSGAWALTVFRNLLTGRPAAVSDAPSFSNTTDVVNVASYLVHLASQGIGHAGARYHHLAEFSAVRWQDWIEPIAAAMEIEPVYAESWWLPSPMTSRQEISTAVESVKLRRLYQTLVIERVAGSMLRSTIRKIPTPLQGKLRTDDVIFTPAPELGRIEQIILENMAGRQEFRSAVESDWTPPLSREESLERVLDWVAAG